MATLSKQNPFRIVGPRSPRLASSWPEQKRLQRRGRLGASSGCSRKEAVVVVVGPCGRLEPVLVLHRAMQSLVQGKGEAAAGASRGGGSWP